MGEFTYGQLIFMVLFSFACIMVPGLLAGVAWWWDARKPRKIHVARKRRLRKLESRRAA
jgi:uncharacterized iron-regulated membrane protein